MITRGKSSPRRKETFLMDIHVSRTQRIPLLLFSPLKRKVEPHENAIWKFREGSKTVRLNFTTRRTMVVGVSSRDMEYFLRRIPIDHLSYFDYFKWNKKKKKKMHNFRSNLFILILIVYNFKFFVEKFYQYNIFLFQIFQNDTIKMYRMYWKEILILVISCTCLNYLFFQHDSTRKKSKRIF